MKKIIKKLAQCSIVWLLVAGIACTSSYMTVCAEEPTTPSGIAFSEIGAEIEEYAANQTYQQ